MICLTEECLDVINNGHFQFVEPGPLHQPICSFSLSRNDGLTLIVETSITSDSTSSAVEHLPGTVRLTTELAKLTNSSQAEAEFVGVAPYSVRTADGDDANRLKEVAKIHLVTVTLGDLASATYTIDWLENLPSSLFIWPDLITTTPNSAEARTISLDNNGLTISNRNERSSSSMAAAKLEISGVTIYVCALGCNGMSRGIKPGCIIYHGTPDDVFRKKVRTALSFALGLYLVDLGYTIYDRDWHVIKALSLSAYTLGRRAFEIGPEQLAPLGSSYPYELNRPQLNRAVNAFVSHYEKLDLANLSWAYWHACAATPHVAPAHFGAAIEALQNAYIRAYSSIDKTLVSEQIWIPLKAAMVSCINQTDISDEIKDTMVRKLDDCNRVNQRPLLKAVLGTLHLQLSRDEDNAWKRRNHAAHGTPIPEGKELTAIRDMKLLRGLFQRMLLRITNAADEYIDYASVNHPFRRLEDTPAQF